MGLWEKLSVAVELTHWKTAWKGAISSGYTYGPELISNTTFDTDLSGWSYTWGVSDCSATEAYEGAKCARLRRGGGATMALYTEVVTEIGSTYEFTAYCKVGINNGSTVGFLCAGEDHSLKIANIATSQVTDPQYDTSYKKLTLTFVAVGVITTISLRHGDPITDAVLGYDSVAYFDNASCKKRTGP